MLIPAGEDLKQLTQAATLTPLHSQRNLLPPPNWEGALSQRYRHGTLHTDAAVRCGAVTPPHHTTRRAIAWGSACPGPGGRTRPTPAAGPWGTSAAVGVDVDEMVRGGGGGGSAYGLLAGDGGLPEAEEAVAVAAAPRASGALGTPARPIWQRRVLMGVRCQLPRFSGMVLYDERGRPLGGGVRDRARDQEKHAAAIDNILRDL
ncbi:hypothetical protein ZWY2020_001172 [Hordeum vulgare]|nr:hypothetical protein ZWY2020_001172 [Hordeum vulgare]